MLLRGARREATGVSAKSSATDLVSDADRASEAAIVAAIAAEFPGDAIVAEEGSLSTGTSGLTWYVDPLDGTINYLYGIPHWSVVICRADVQGATEDRKSTRLHSRHVKISYAVSCSQKQKKIGR